MGLELRQLSAHKCRGRVGLPGAAVPWNTDGEMGGVFMARVANGHTSATPVSENPVPASVHLAGGVEERGTGMSSGCGHALRKAQPHCMSCGTHMQH